METLKKLLDWIIKIINLLLLVFGGLGGVNLLGYAAGLRAADSAPLAVELEPVQLGITILVITVLAQIYRFYRLKSGKELPKIVVVNVLYALAFVGSIIFMGEDWLGFFANFPLPGVDPVNWFQALYDYAGEFMAMVGAVMFFAAGLYELVLDKFYESIGGPLSLKRLKG